jgi:ClpP class serine protease
MIRSDLTYALSAGKPLLIDPLKARAFLASAHAILNNPDLAYLLSQYVSGDKYENKPKGRRNQRADFGDFEGPDAARDSGVALSCTPYVRDCTGIIPVRGVIGKCLSPLEAMLGCADVDVITKALQDWEKNDNVYEVVFHMDSGGGSTTGLEELAKKIRNYPKPTISFTDSDCGSAAYWIASQCKRFVVTPSSSIGACGVYITMTDESEKYAKEGKRVEVIKSGEHKAAGVEGTSLSETQREGLQGEVDELHRRFVRDVRSVRTYANPMDLQGQSFYGDVAANRGLATGVMDSFEDLLKDIKDTRLRAHNSVLPAMYTSDVQNVSPYIG